MKILKLMAYYFPENVSSSEMEKEIEQSMVEQGFQITIITPQPTRGCTKLERKRFLGKEIKENGNVVIHRFKLFKEPKNIFVRTARYLCCNIIEYFLAIKEKDVDIILVGSTPPTQIALARRVSAKLKVPYILRIQDIFPDSLVNTKLIRKTSIIYKIGDKMTKDAYLYASRIMTISGQMKKTLIQKGVREEKIEIVPNWINTNHIRKIEQKDNYLISQYGLSTDNFYVVYAGNIGLTQNIEMLVRAASLLKEENKIKFVIIGKGVDYKNVVDLANKLKCDNVLFLPFQDSSKAAFVYSLGSVSIVICKKGTGGSAVPSKTWSIMACETPIIAAFDNESDLCTMINSNDCGWCVPPDDYELLAKTILYAFQHKDILIKKGRNGRKFAVNHISSEKCIEKYIECLVKAKSNEESD